VGVRPERYLVADAHGGVVDNLLAGGVRLQDAVPVVGEAVA
jgi:hypothetical protein